MKLALVYDHLNKIGGAEEILKQLHKLWPSAPWYTSLHNSRKVPFTKKWQVTSSSLSRIPLLKDNHESIPFLMPIIFESYNFDDFDVVLSTSSSSAKSIITKPHTLHLNYCLTPTRYLWSHASEYLSSNQFGIIQRLFRPVIIFILRQLRVWDSVIAHRPDVMIAISDHVKKRIQEYYNRDAVVVYPPVDIQKFEVPSNHIPSEQGYYLTVSRLVPYKKLDLLIQTFNKLDRQLVIVGTGTHLRKLKRLASDNIIFTNHLPEDQLIGYYQHCRAFLQVNEEDFGIAMVEAQAAGKPVIAYNKGGASEIITSKSGILFDVQSINAIMQSVKKFETMTISANSCRQNAARFSQEIFRKNIKKTIEETWQKHTRSVSMYT